MSYNRRVDSLSGVGQRRNPQITTTTFVTGAAQQTPQTRSAVQGQQQVASQQGYQQQQVQQSNGSYRAAQTPQRTQLPPQQQTVGQQQQQARTQLPQQQQTVAQQQQQQQYRQQQLQQQQQQQQQAAAQAAAAAAAAAAAVALPKPPPPSTPAPPTPKPGVVGAVSAAANAVAQPATEKMDATSFGGDEANKADRKPFWANKTGPKISRKEKQRRRNIRLSKMLQPKNAIMILNELVKNCTYNVTDVPQQSQPNQYMASVLVEDKSHVGYGLSKNEAKNNAAESALKYIVKKGKLTPSTESIGGGAAAQAAANQDESGDVKMETDNADAPDNSILPWQHVASFALFKLLNSWGEDPFKNHHPLATANGSDGGSNAGAGHVPMSSVNKPAKKMPDNAADINPLMLMNQMLPQAQFEELAKQGESPNVQFTFKCTVDGRTFSGSGSSKKAAKKVCAFAVCNQVLNVQYPAEIYTPSA